MDLKQFRAKTIVFFIQIQFILIVKTGGVQNLERRNIEYPIFRNS